MPLELPTKLQKVGGLWQRTSGRGHVYFAGGNREQKFYVFKNANAGSGQPEWNLYVEGKTLPEAAAPERKRRKRKPQQSQPQRVNVQEPKPFDDPVSDLFDGCGIVNN